MRKAGTKSGDGRRPQRMEKELQFHVARYLTSAYKGEIPGLMTVTQVKVPPDLRSAHVFVSVLNGSKAENEHAIKVLETRRGEIQTYVHKQLPMKHTPVLKFFIDQGLERALRIESLLKEIDQNKKI